MESDRSEKKTSLEELSKDDVIKKYNNLLTIAKKAKQSKQETLEELKKAAEKEAKLTLEINALKEVIDSFTEKQKQFAELENAVKQTNDKVTELKSSLQKIEGNLALKIIECNKMEEKLAAQEVKFSALEEKYLESLEKLEDFKESYAKVDIEKKLCQEKLLLCEQEKKEKENLNLQYKEMVSENKRLAESLSEKERQLKDLSEKHVRFNEQYKNIPENWNEVASENKKLKALLKDAEDTKEELMCERDLLKKSILEFEKKSKEYEMISENLLEEEKKNLDLMEEINRLNEKNLAVEKLEQALNICEEEKQEMKLMLDECHIRYNQEIKSLEEKLEKGNSNSEKEELEGYYKKQKLEFENQVLKSCQEKSELLKAEKENLKTFLEKEKEIDVAIGKEAELGESCEREKLLLREKKELENSINALKAELSLKAKEWENRLLAEKENNKKLEEKNYEMEKLIAQMNQSETSKSEKLLERAVENLQTEMKMNSEKLEGESEKERKSELEKLVEDTNENLNEKMELWESSRGQLFSEKENERREKGRDLGESDDEERERVKANESFNKPEERFGKQVVEQSEMVKGLNTEFYRAREALETSQQQEAREESKENYLSEENKCLKEEIEKIKCNYNESVHLVRLKLEGLLNSFKKIKSLRKCFDEEVKIKLKAFQLEQTEARENIEEIVLKYVGQLHCGNSELLSEMNDMNQVLKERGEAISKLEELTERQRKELDEAVAKIASQSGKLIEKNEKIDRMEEEVSKAKSEVEIKHKAMREMEEEMWRLKNGDSQGEALSSSTISRAEDSTRLMELEESFEEKYTKLKVVAVKLKKKVTELQKQVETERNSLMAAESDYRGKVADFQIQIKSLRNIQTEYDKLQDLLDGEKREKNYLKNCLESAQEEAISIRQQLEEVKSEREKFKVDKISFEKIKKELTVHIGELKQTVEKGKRECGRLEKEIEEMRIQLSVKERHVEEEREKHKAAILLLEEQKSDSKKQSVLELEMAAYEKTAEDLKRRLDVKGKQVEELENRLEIEMREKASLKEETIRLEGIASGEKIKLDTCEERLKRSNEESNSLREEIEKKAEAIKSLERIVEEKNVKIEGLSAEIEESTKEKYKSEERFKRNEEKFCRQIRNLEEKISSLQDVLSQEGMELEELKREYQAYKVRAQSVLRQSQGETNPSRRQNVLEELEQLKSTSDSLKSRFEDSNRRLKKSTEENGSLREEKNKLIGRIQELNSAVIRLREENQKLKEVKQRESEEHAESMRIQKLQSETLAQCFQREMESLRSNHAERVEELKGEIERIQKWNQSPFKPDVRRIEFPETRQTTGCFAPVKPEKEILDVMLLEREECEGSEIVDSTSPRQEAVNLVPLDRLLGQSDSPFDEKNPSKKSSSLQEVDRLAGSEKRFGESENRIRHLTILLAESESDSARLTQLNEFLKEEIKRLQRSLEREKHAENFEYLKNVIVKFAALQSGEERLRLVPVLNTILKLSPEEENVLANCARGVSESGNRKWGLMGNLGIWPKG